MNIIYINHYAGSPDMGMEFRPYYLAKEWIKMGHDVTIIAADYSHLRRKNPEVKKDFQREIIDGVRYLWVKTKKYSGNGVNRAFTMYEFVHKIKKRAKWLSEVLRPDIVITSSTYPLDTYAGQKIRKYSNAKLIHEVHDMWPESLIYLGGMKKNNPFVKLIQKGENSFCKKSDFIVSLLPNADIRLVNHGMEKEKYIHIPNGVVLEEWSNPEDLPSEHKKVLEKIRKRGDFIICFFGSHTKSYNLEILIDTVEEIKNVSAVFIGSGIFKEELKRKVGTLNDKVYFLDPISKKSVPSLFKYIDATYISLKSDKLNRYGVAMNKLFDSMMGGKPIIFAASVPNDYVSKYNCGITCIPEDLGELKKAIRKLTSISESDRNRMGENGRRAVAEVFNYPKIAKKFETVFMRGKNE